MDCLEETEPEKTTTMKMLLGLTKPTSGEVKIWGKALQGNEKNFCPVSVA